MIGPVHNFADLGIKRSLITARPEPIPDRTMLDPHVERVASEVGLAFQPGAATGLYLVVPQPDGSRLRLRRVSYYALAEPQEIADAARAIVEMAAREFGAGRVWSLGGHVRVVARDVGAVVVPPSGLVRVRDDEFDLTHEFRLTPGHFIWPAAYAGDRYAANGRLIGNPPHVVVRAWFCHEKGPQHDEVNGDRSASIVTPTGTEPVVPIGDVS